MPFVLFYQPIRPSDVASASGAVTRTYLAFEVWIFYAATAYFTRRDLVWVRVCYITQPSLHLKGQICTLRLHRHR